MDCATFVSLAFQLSALIVTTIFGLFGIMITLIKISQKEK